MGMRENIRQRHYLAHILISEADVGFSLEEVDPLNGWPVGQKEAQLVDRLTRGSVDQRDAKLKGGSIGRPDG
jgi:hypothetical protein